MLINRRLDCIWKQRLWQSCVLLTMALVLPHPAAGDDLAEFRALVQKLIALQEARYDAISEWRETRPVVESRARLLRQRKDQARADLDETLEKERELQTEMATVQSAEESARKHLAQLAEPLRHAEQRLRDISSMLPQPLIDSLGEDLKNLPAPDAAVAPEDLPDRMRYVFGVLTEVQQFAGSVHLVRQRLRGPDGNMRELEVLYLGLGAAFAVSASDTVAASGHPGPDGWTWQWHAEIAEDVRTAVEIFRKERPAQFVSLPLELVVNPEGEK